MSFNSADNVPVHVFSMDVDVASQLASLANLTSGGSVLSSFEYTLDPAGNRTRVIEASGNRTTWTYDATYQLTREHRTGVTAFCITHVYDPAGNRLQEVANGSRKTFTYDAANQLATSDDSTGRTTYTYDASGNLAIQAAPGGRTTNTWDAENRLLLVQAPAGVINTMTYSADGVRVHKVDSSGASNYLWDGLILLSESDANGNAQAVYTHQPAAYGGLASGRRKTGGAWVPSYYHYDGLGSTDRMTDAAESVTDSYSYYAYGGSAASNSSTANPFRWVGQLGYYFDSDLAQYYIRARHYDPVTARWLSEDPIGSDSNVYAYVSGNPHAYVDAAGLEKSAEECCFDWVKDNYPAPVIQSTKGDRTCWVRVECKSSCGGAPGSTGDLGMNNTIAICLNYSWPSDNYAYIVAHEMEHAQQACDGDRRPCMKRERDAHRVNCKAAQKGKKILPGPAALEKCVSCGIKKSCPEDAGQFPNLRCTWRDLGVTPPPGEDNPW